MVCFILQHVDVDETNSQSDSDISSSDAGTFEFVALKCERTLVAYCMHSLNGSGVLASVPTDVETQHIQSSIRF